MAPTPSVTELLHAVRAGDEQAHEAVYERTYEALRRLAHGVRRGRAGDTLNTTALVHEAYLKLLPSPEAPWEDRAHFLRVAARAMRQVLVDAARHRTRLKRGGAARAVTFDDALHEPPLDDRDLLALDGALGALERLDARAARVVECRFFAGLTVEETADALGLSAPTVKRDWRAARAWLARELAAP